MDENDPLRSIHVACGNIKKNFTISEKEALAVVVGCQVFDVYLLGQPFPLLTDHSALKQIFDNRNTSPQLTRWALACRMTCLWWCAIKRA